MARSRNIKPGFFTNDELAELPALTRLLFIALWTLVDREGRIEDRPKKIKAEALPYDDGDADQMLQALAEAGFITRYVSGGTKCIQVNNWKKHQNPHVKEQPSELPEPEVHEASTVHTPDKQQPSTEVAGLIPSLLIPDSLKENLPASPDREPEGFKTFFDEWPKTHRKGSRGKCLELWRKKRLEGSAPVILAHLTGMKASSAWRDPQYIPAPLVYLNKQAWDGAEAPATDSIFAGAL
jgi:hypothetical protein